jgi:CAAX prenyl protease-like protein
VFFLWVLPYPGWATLGAGGAGFNPTQPDGTVNLLLAAIRLSGAALVVPVMEELFWRSFIMRWLDRPDFMAADPMHVDRRAFFVTALLFAVEHHLWLAGLLAGIAFGWLYKVCRNLWAPVLAHGVTNAMLGIWVLSRGAWQYW